MRRLLVGLALAGLVTGGCGGGDGADDGGLSAADRTRLVREQIASDQSGMADKDRYDVGECRSLNQTDEGFLGDGRVALYECAVSYEGERPEPWCATFTTDGELDQLAANPCDRLND